MNFHIQIAFLAICFNPIYSNLVIEVKLVLYYLLITSNDYYSIEEETISYYQLLVYRIDGKAAISIANQAKRKY